HPLDCPICDQGGECDLQDQAMAYGFDRGRYEENKRAVRDKDFGPLVATSMNRCIHCTRCIRFLTEIAGVEELGATGRGEAMEINEEWISDKTRFAHDGLIHRRLDRPYVRRGGRLVEAEWREALDLVADRLKAVPGERVAAIAGDLCDAEAMFALKELLHGLGATSLDCRQDGAKLDGGCRAGYLFNTTIAGIEQADACLLIGTDPRWEAPLINARLRKRYLQGGFRVAAIGPALDLSFPVEMLGDGGAALNTLVAGEHPWAELLPGAKASMIVLGQGALSRPDGARVLGAGRAIA